MKALKTLSELIASKEVVLADDVQITASINGVVISSLVEIIKDEETEEQDAPKVEKVKKSRKKGKREYTDRSCWRTGITKEDIYAEMLSWFMKKKIEVPIGPGFTAVPVSVKEIPTEYLKNKHPYYRKTYRRLYKRAIAKGYTPTPKK